MAVNPKKGLLMWPEYSDNDIDFFIANAASTISENRTLISRLRGTITTYHRRAEQARSDEERDRWEGAVSATRTEIEKLSDHVKRLDGNKRAAVRELERRRSNNRWLSGGI
ncbi:hypothetical protein EPUS_07601 [Endocarpon pusillum Z07020]|uniref:Uncharacterized protein n=1 Tax=Endocarpon pusillum (strain Z07020 / HMAS-L-300199) TaxID=1263415 RepID=U1GF20_ENDPU|nr:uncharacterized protein EPUS_07601 [Endocarpon pusillum Z07020]ERF70336.1 hypothetical protein EPUS_07601 [Endocarpon pusillum Z07020]